MMQFVLLLFTLVLLSYRPVLNEVILADFQEQALSEHNLKRQIHCTGPMTLNSTINEIAQNYSEYLAANNLFVHSGHPGLGENLYKISSSNQITYLNGSTPTDAWYNEISSYNFDEPGYSDATGHFTQVVWKSSIQLGIGIAFSSNNQSATVVANYYPPGNVEGEFAANVLPPCSDNMGGD